MTNVLPMINPAGRYSVTQTANILEIDRSTLYRNTRNGRIRMTAYVSDNRGYYKGIEIIRFFKQERDFNSKRK